MSKPLWDGKFVADLVDHHARGIHIDEDGRRSIYNLKDDTIVIVNGCRSAITKSRKGGFKHLKADQLLAPVLHELLRRTDNLPYDRIGDIVVGNVLQPGGGQAMARMAMLCAGFSSDIPVASVNRQCASGLQAIANVVGAISNRMYDIGIAAGVESMSSCSFQGATPIVDLNTIKKHEEAASCLIPMGITSENVAERYRVSRRAQDRFALNSHQKANNAKAKGYFTKEIVSIAGVNEDDGVRRGTSFETLSKLKPAFKRNGSTTAGNASQLSDGASAVFVANGKSVKELGLPVLAIWRKYTVVGVPPDIMGIGPAFAINDVLFKARLTVDDIDVFEINEAFASQVVFCMRFLGLPEQKVNPCGGAIALGHPLGCSGNRLVVTCAHYLQLANLRYGCVSLCIGTGMGAAVIIENPQFDASKKSYKYENKSNLEVKNIIPKGWQPKSKL